MSIPSVSVIVATYRRKDELVRALDSLGKQKYKNFEIILVDDNADPEWNQYVSRTVKNFMDKFPNVAINFLVNTKNSGSAKSRNLGIFSSTNDFITFLDDDDEYLPNKLSNQVANMLEFKSDYCITDIILYDEKSRIIDKRIRNYIKETDQNSLLKYHLMYHMTGTDSLMFKTDYIKRIGGFLPIDLGDEFYLMNQAIEAGGKFSYLHGCDIKAYIHNDGTGLSRGDNKLVCENELYKFKREKFLYLDNKTVNYINMRHYAVLSYAHFGNRNILSTVGNGLLSFFSSPYGFLKLIKERKL